MTRTILFAVGLAGICAGSAHIAAQGPTPSKTEVARVTGCVKELAPNNWMLVNATDAAPIALGASTAVAGSSPTIGKNRFKLIGVGTFNLPSRKGQTVVVQGLLIKAAPESRLNVTSVAPLSATCAAAPK